MCGVPHHAARGYVAKLLEKGFKVAICDQVEEPGKSAIVKREVTRVVTPGMVLDDQVLDPREASYLGVVALGDGRAPGSRSSTPPPASSSAARWGTTRALVDELRRAGVRELVLPLGADDARVERVQKAVGVPAARRPAADFERAEEKLRRHLGVPSLDGFGVAGAPLGLAAAAAALAYLADTQRAAPRHVDRISRLRTDDVLLLDEATRTNLELERTLAGARKKGSLLALLDRSVTAAGGAAARGVAPLPAHRSRRHPRAARRGRGARLGLGRARGSRRGAPAGRRRGAAPLAARAGAGERPRPARPRRRAARAPRARRAPRRRARRRSCATPARGCAASRSSRRTSIAPSRTSRPRRCREGGIIRRGFSPELDEIVAVAEDGKDFIARLEAREKERTGIASLKVRFNKVFGYYLEVTKANLHAVPADYERRQTTVGGERFVTPELKRFEEKVLTAEERRAGIEARLFEELRQRVAEAAPRIRTAADAVATADVLLALGRVAAERGYVRPEVDGSEVLEIVDGRHPVVEAVLPEGPAAFVPNDVLVASRGATECEKLGALHVITGPNMAGKSTVMRQVALVTLLAQMGIVRAGAARARRHRRPDLHARGRRRRPRARPARRSWSR